MGSSVQRYLIEYLLTEARAEVIADAVMDVEDGIVIWAGRAVDAPPITSADDDADRGPSGDPRSPIRLDGLVIPGLVNAHCHTPMLLMRGAGEGLGTTQWLHEVIWPRESRLRADDVATAMRVGAAEMLRNGITASVEMYFFGDEMAVAARDVGLRATITPPLIDDDSLVGFGPLEEQLAAIVDLAERWADDDLIDIGIGPHSAYSLSSTTLEQVAATAAALHLLVHIHVAEQRDEGDAIAAATGLSVPVYLDRIGLLGPRTLAAHCVWVDRTDIELFAERDVAVVHCPASNGRHGTGIAPVRALRDAGVRVAIGTDGPVSHDRLDLFEDLRSAVRYARIRDCDAGALSARDALEMAMSGSALGRADLGRLGVGSAADFVRIDIDGPGFEPLLSAAELAERLVWCTHPEQIRDCWVAGRQRMADRVVLGVDLDAARADLRDRARYLAAGGDDGVPSAS